MEEQKTKRAKIELEFCRGDTCVLGMEDDGVRYGVVLYHGGCNDGFGALCTAAHMHLSSQLLHNKVANCSGHRFIGISPNSVPTEKFTNDHVLMVDVSFTPRDLEGLEYKSMTIIDHHQSAIDAFKGVTPRDTTLILDKTMSASELTWKTFNKARLMSECPVVLRYIGDRDTWKWQMTNSRLVNFYLRKGTTFSIHNLVEVNKWMYSTYEAELLKEAEKWREAWIVEQRAIDGTLKEATLHTMTTPKTQKSYRVWLATCGYDLVSEVGSALAQRTDCDFAAIWKYHPDGNVYQFMARSNSDRVDIDVSRIASEFEHNGRSGGGHAQAAGFYVRLPPILEVDPASSFFLNVSETKSPLEGLFPRVTSEDKPKTHTAFDKKRHIVLDLEHLSESTFQTLVDTLTGKLLQYMPMVDGRAEPRRKQ